MWLAAVASRSGTVGRAAERLNRTQPSISARIALLEEAWQTRLFRRVARGMLLTPEGARLLPLAEASLGQGGALGQDLSAIRRALLGADPAERAGVILSLLSEHVAKILGHAPEDLDLDEPLTDMGLDSLMAVELRNWIEGGLRMNLPAVELLRGPSVTQLAELVAARFDQPQGEATQAPDPPPEMQDAQELLPLVDEMSDEQVDSLLNELDGNAGR